MNILVIAKQPNSKDSEAIWQGNCGIFSGQERLAVKFARALICLQNQNLNGDLCRTMRCQHLEL